MLPSLLNILIWFVGLFHKDSADKLAELRVKGKGDDAVIKGLETKNAVVDGIHTMSDDELAHRMHTHIH